MPFFGVPIRNGLPIGLGSVAGFGVQQFDPSQLFEGGTVAGAWYDPSDLSTMFDTSAGTTPVAMPGLGAAVPVGLMLDKSQNGVGTNGAKRVNLLTYSEEFDNGAWTKNNSTVANTTATTDPLGGTTADVYTNTGSGDWLNTASAITIVAGLNYTYSIYAKRGTQDWLRLSGWNDVAGIGITQAFNAWFNLATGVKGTLSSGADGTAVSHDMVSVGNGWYRCTVTGRSTALTTLFPELNMTTADAVTTRPATGNEVYIWGADLRLASEANTLPLYQPITSSWYATLPGNHAIAINNTTARPELRARVNLLTYSEEFDNGAWGKSNTTVTSNSTIAPDGTTTADTAVTANGTFSANLVGVGQNLSWTTTEARTFSFSAKSNGLRFAQCGVHNFAGFTATIGFDLQTGAVAASGGNYCTFSNASILSQGNGWFRCTVTITPTSTDLKAPYIAGSSAMGGVNNRDATGDGTSGIYLWGADLRPTNIGANVPAYQRIADANTYDTSGFPLYLRFDGIDDSMYTPASIPFATVTSDGQARRNLLNNPTQFDVTTSWTATNATVTANNATAPDGTLTAETLTSNGVSAVQRVGQNTTQTGQVTFSVYAKAGTAQFLQILNAADGNCFANFDLATPQTGTKGTGATSTITVDTSGWCRCTITFTLGSAAQWYVYLAPSASATYGQFFTATVAALSVWGAQLELGSTVTAFQNIGTDKVAVFAGVRKLSDAAGAIVAEFSANMNVNNGTFLIAAPGSQSFSGRTKGTLEISGEFGPTGIPAPATRVLTLIGDIGADIGQLYVNGVLGGQKTTDQGTGNYGTYPLYIGSRGNSAFRLNGHLYSLIIAGSAVSAGNISATEQWVAGKTGIQI